jgi:imidazolonepropionase-like amidohydrolase
VSYGVSDTIGTLGAVAVSAQLSEAMGLDLYKSYVRQDYRMQRRAIELAHLQGIPVTSHELYPAVANGIDYMEHLGATSRRGFSLKQSRLGWAYQDVIELINRSGVVVVPTIAMTERPGRDMTPAFETLRRIDAGGGHFVAGTDSPFIAHAVALHRELELYAKAGIDPSRVLRSATADAADALGAGDMLGRIAVGHMADLLVLDADPLAEMRAIRGVELVVQNGEPVACTAADVAWIPSPAANHAH